MPQTKKTVLITGANRGLGLGLVQHFSRKGSFRVLAACRKTSDMDAILKRDDLTGVEVLSFDASDETSRSALIETVSTKHGGVDILINNAGIFLDAAEGADASALKGKPATLRATLEVNTVAPFQLMSGLVPGMLGRGFGRIVNVSSGMGQLSEMMSGYPSYRASKSALNALTKLFAQEVLGRNVLINAVCPGWVRTDMGGASAHRTIEKGVAGIIWAAELPDGGPTGGFFRDGKPLAW